MFYAMKSHGIFYFHYCMPDCRVLSVQLMTSIPSQFCDYGIEGVVPPELLPPDVRSKFSSKPAEKAKRPKREETKGTSAQAKEQQVLRASSGAYLY